MRKKALFLCLFLGCSKESNSSQEENISFAAFKDCYAFKKEGSSWQTPSLCMQETQIPTHSYGFYLQETQEREIKNENFHNIIEYTTTKNLIPPFEIPTLSNHPSFKEGSWEIMFPHQYPDFINMKLENSKEIFILFYPKSNQSINFEGLFPIIPIGSPLLCQGKVCGIVSKVLNFSNNPLKISIGYIAKTF